MGRMVGTPGLRLSLEDARRRTDELFALVRPDAFFDRPVPERHRLNFYLGHVEAFDANMICRNALGLGPVHADFDELFAFGVDPDASDLPSDKVADWPGIAETRSYCRGVRARVDEVLDEVPAEVAHVCVEHRLMHAETLCYLLNNLDPSKLRRPGGASADSLAERPSRSLREWVEIPAGPAKLGRERATGFGWDNEFGPVTRDVPAFSVRTHKVTNGEYLGHVEQGGSVPHYWRRSGRGWRLRTMFGETELPLDWPVYVTHEQAREFAAQAGAALPSEAQWDRAAYGSPDGTVTAFPWGDAAPEPHRANLAFHRWDPCAVTATPGGDSPFGVAQMLGNGWEWTSDPLRPFPGFERYPFYPDYSSAFFDDEHYVLKGASPRTDCSLIRRSFRNWFREGYPYVYATLRLVMN